MKTGLRYGIFTILMLLIFALTAEFFVKKISIENVDDKMDPGYRQSFEDGKQVVMDPHTGYYPEGFDFTEPDEVWNQPLGIHARQNLWMRHWARKHGRIPYSR